MRIAFFHELPEGGALRAVNALANQMKKRHEIDLYYVSPKRINNHNEYFSKVFYFKFIPKKWIGKNWRIRLYKDTLELLSLYKMHKKIAIQVKKNNYDLIFVHASQYTQSPFLLREDLKNKVFYLHDPSYRMLYENVLKVNNLDIFRRNYEKINRYVRKLLDRANVNSAELVIANSKYTEKTFKKIYGIESQLGYLGVDEFFFKPNNRKKLFDILFIGSREKVDGLDLLEKAESLFKIKIVIRKVLIEKEWVDDQEIRELYQSSKVVVCLAHNEPLGLVALEAMACGVPVVAVNEGGYKETIIDGKTGFLIKRSPAELAQRIELLLTDNKLYDLFSKEARINVDNNWTWETSSRRIEDIFKKFVL